MEIRQDIDMERRNGIGGDVLDGNIAIKLPIIDLFHFQHIRNDTNTLSLILISSTGILFLSKKEVDRDVFSRVNAPFVGRFCFPKINNIFVFWSDNNIYLIIYINCTFENS